MPTTAGSRSAMSQSHLPKICEYVGPVLASLKIMPLAGSNGPGPCHLLGSAQLLQIAQGGDQGFDVVPVDGAYIIEAHFLEQSAGEHHALQVLLRAAGKFPHRGHLAQDLLAALAQMRVHASRQG